MKHTKTIGKAIRSVFIGILCLALLVAMVPAVFATGTESQLPELPGSSMTLGNTLEINFAIDITSLEGDGHYAVISKEYADDRGTVSKTIPQSQWTNYTDTLDYVSYSVSAKEMSDKLTVVVYNAAGEQVCKTYEDSVATYCLRMLGKEEVKEDPNTKIMSLFVDMLNYGAAAQTEWGYNTDDLANAGLTETQKGYATTVSEKNNIQVKGEGYYGTSLSLKENILMNAAYYTAQIQDAAYAEVSFVDHYGNDESQTIQAEDFKTYSDEVTYIEITAMAVADYCQSVTITLYDANGNVLSTTVDSVESYISRMSGDLYEAILAFGEGAYNYFHGEDAPSAGDNVIELSTNVSAENGQVSETATFGNEEVSAQVPAGVQVESNTLTLTVTEKESSDSGIEAAEGEELLAMDIHIEGVSKENTTAIQVYLGQILPKGLNMGNITLYHTEDGIANAMTQVMTLAELDEHNEFYYDPATGDITVAMASFSEVAMVSTNALWNGEADHTWYTNAEEGTTVYTIANADQLWSFSQIVGGMAESIEQDSFSGKTVKLIADIDLNDDEENNDPDKIFYPIGYNSDDGKYEKTGVAINSSLKTFEGEFDGQGHTISNFYQNTWEMKGDHNWYDATLQYYRDGMGLFGRIYGGAVRNLTVKNFKSDGEIATTGTIAAYAEGATFENIAIFDCNPRVYNIGNGGIVGCVGWYAKEAGLKTTFENITVDNSNKISALWGSYDVACGGLVGQYYPTSGQSSANYPVNGGIEMINCHVAAQMDVYNDVCANYQYYAYRYAGILIGSVRENETINGHSYPKMDGITAKDCTVHFGDWNDYYYCELVANSLASYTHDHQFSRLEQVASVDAENMTVISLKGETTAIPTSGRYNYVVVNGKHATENATCYHFVDGKVHNHDDYNGDGIDDYETVNGESLLVENNRHIYLEFNNLVTGYGWGVTSKGVGDMEGVTILDREEGSSVVKFESVAENSYTTGKTVTIGELFAAIENVADPIDTANVQVFVSPVGDDSTAGGTYTANTSDWTKGTLTFSGTGAATITITDYNYCTPTTIDVTVTERKSEEKFETKFTGDFLYRVGNQNAVALSCLFEGTTDVKDADVTVTYANIEGNAGMTYTANTSDWDAGTVKFTGTGVVEVSITDNDYCTPTTLCLEVINAENLTSAKGTTTGGTFVLVSDVNTSSYVYYWNCTVYGNGFTYSLKGAPTAYDSKQGHGILITQNATLDNLVIIGDVYSSYGAYSSQDYYNTAIDVRGDTTIQNCYIANCAAPIKARSNVTIINSTLYGGAVANLLILSGTATLENVTTANYDDGRSLVGMGIVIHSDATDSAKLVLNGTLTQYNFISESNAPTDTYAKQLYSAMFSEDCSIYHFGTSPNRYVNTGIISMTAEFNADDLKDNASTGYSGKALVVSSYDGYVYTQPSTNGSVNNNFSEYKPTTQGVVAPEYSFDYTDKNYIAKTEGSNDYCYYENNKVNISMDDGDTFNWDTSILTVTKVGNDLNYTVSMNGIDYTGKSIAFNTAGENTIQYTYTDPYNYVEDENGNITTTSKTYTQTVNVSVAVIKATTKHAEFTFGSSNTASTTVVADNKTYVMPNVSGTSSTIGSTTVDGKTIYYPIVEIIMSDGKTSHTSGWYAYFPVFSNAVTITDYKDNGTGDAETFGSSTQSMPSGLSVNGDPTQLFKYQSSSAAGSSPVVKNNILVYSSPSISAKRSEYNTVIEYIYQDNAGSTYYYYIGYHAPAQSYTSCFTSDTLVTLADGTQKRIDEVAYTDELLVWNFYTGEYDAMPSSIIKDYGYDNHTIVTLNFDDGTSVNTINGHGFFDQAANEYVILDEYNVEDYIGHSFLKQDNDGYKAVTLTDYQIKTEYVECWSVLTAEHYNCLINGLFSLTPAAGGNTPDYLMPFALDENMKYDEAKMQADIEKYGLYTYEDFAPYITYEQFEALGLDIFKVSVGKGYITWDSILMLLQMHIV